MIDAAIGLASERENWAVVLAILAFAALLYLLTGRIASKQRRFWINFVATAAAVLAVMIWGAYKAPPPPPEGPAAILIAKDMGPVPITPAGATVELEDVVSLKGWGEGENGPINGGTLLEHGSHASNVELEEAPRIFARVLREMSHAGTGEWIAGMSQQQWEQFLVGLGTRGRREISSIPFARIRLRASDGHEQRVVMFRYDAALLRDRPGRQEIAVCVLRVFNIRESATRGSEAVYLGLGDRGCRNPGRRGIEIRNVPATGASRPAPTRT